MTDRLLYSPREAARLLSVCERTLWGLTDDGKLPAVRVGRAVRYTAADLSKYVEGLRVAAVDGHVEGAAR